jgi:hypothetical protein
LVLYIPADSEFCKDKVVCSGFLQSHIRLSGTAGLLLFKGVSYIDGRYDPAVLVKGLLCNIGTSSPGP